MVSSSSPGKILLLGPSIIDLTRMEERQENNIHPVDDCTLCNT